jgi:hypothetical protein
MSPFGGGGAPQVPTVPPGGTVHGRPAQQSPLVVHAPPDGEQVEPQRRTPEESGKHGAPPQHSDENVHCWPTPMQHGATPV